MDQRKAIPVIPINKLFPNVITILALCLGATSIRYALDYQLEIAAGLVIISALLDGIDGRIARLLNAASDFGAHLDSIADMVNFGIAPAVIVYTWSLHEIPHKGLGWAIILLYITCSALRLARFNTQLEDEEALKKGEKFFTGIPMPSAALLSIIPMISNFQLLDYKFPLWLVATYIFVISLLVVSRVPTFSAKKVNIRKKYVSMWLVLIGMVVSVLLLEPWIFLPFLGIIYLCSIPVSTYLYWRSYK